jgi:hypothetical protein
MLGVAVAHIFDGVAFIAITIFDAAIFLSFVRDREPAAPPHRLAEATFLARHLRIRADRQGRSRETRQRNARGRRPRPRNASIARRQRSTIFSRGEGPV